VALLTGTQGEHPARERVGCAESAVLVHQQLTDVRAGLDEGAEGVERLGEGQGGVQGVAGGEPLARGDRDRRLSSQPSTTVCGSSAGADPSSTARIAPRACA
jgi:hypothetical protein